MDNIPVSVIITGKNSAGILPNCLNSLKNQSYSNYEIIYIDAGSTNNSYDIAKKYDIKILVDESANTPALGRNIGIKIATGQIIAFVDTDCQVPVQWIETIVNSLRNNEDVACVGGSFKPPEDSNTFIRAIYHIFSTFLGSGGSVQAKRFQHEKYVESVPAGNSAYKKNILDKVGLFNPKLRFCEDYELNQRIRNEGKRILYHPELDVTHNKNYNPRSFFHHMFSYGKGRANSRLYSKNLIKPIHVIPSLIISITPILFFLSIYSQTIFLIRNFYIILLIILFLLSILTSFLTMFKQKKYSERISFFYLPLIYILLYLGYGFGFLYGLLQNLKIQSLRTRINI